MCHKRREALQMQCYVATDANVMAAAAAPISTPLSRQADSVHMRVEHT